ncbi:MAG TPA: hypothetical protein VGE27_10530 [Gemmatimonas sp.]|uniref:hypothetical protein n=1 Tax=Gemmatimonas sp. TaxID=1962908 RepID=UPI002ED797EC
MQSSPLTFTDAATEMARLNAATGWTAAHAASWARRHHISAPETVRLIRANAGDLVLMEEDYDHGIAWKDASQFGQWPDRLHRPC